MKTLWHTRPGSNPAVFVCNHDSAYGPMAMCAHFELVNESRPWINAQTLSVRQIPSYVRTDHWWPRGKWYTKILDYTVPYLAAPFLALINRGSGCIPVYHDAAVATTFNASVKAMEDGMHMILFPERPTGYREYGDRVYTGFVAIAKHYYRRTGKTLSFFPTYIDWTGKEIRVGEPIQYEPDSDYSEHAKRIVALIEEFFSSKGMTAPPEGK